MKARLATRAVAKVALGLVLVACSHGAKRPQAAPTAAPAPAKPLASAGAKSALLQPPPPGITPSAPFPPIVEATLDNGLGLRVVEQRIHPIVELRLVIRSGTATDGEKPGLALVAGELLKAGGAGGLSAQKLVERAEALGASLSIITDRDATRIALGVTSGDVDAALQILADVALRPAFNAVEFEKLRSREIERVRSAARGSAAWVAAMVLYRELYEQPTAVHPYSRYDATPADLAKLQLADCRAWHRAHFVPSNASLVVVGDVSAASIEKAAATWLGKWKGEPAPRPSFSQPFPPKERQVYLVDRPGSAQSQIAVGLLGAERQSNEWPALAAANQILGGGVAGRLFLDVREKRSLAYSTGSSLADVAVGPTPIVLSAGTQTPKTAEAVTALLENLDAIAARPPSQAELESATRFLSDSFLFRLETLGSVADLTSQLYVLGLPNDYYDTYRSAVRGLQLSQVSAAAARYYAHKPVIVVAGDAASLGPSLAKFGPVAVVDPEQSFALKKSYPHAP